MLTSTPIARVMANPLTAGAPVSLSPRTLKPEPSQYKMAQMISVEMFESRMEVQARSKPASMAALRLRPRRNSSFIRSKIKMLASTAMPVESKNPVIPGMVSVTGSIRYMVRLSRA